MAQSVVLPAKHKSEVHQFIADFNSLLTAGDSIIAGTLTVTVTLDTGTDPSPQAILVPGPSILGNIVSQGLQQGLVGCIYTIVIQVHTTLGNVINMNARLAILEDNYPAGGAVITYYFTSQLYPYNLVDSMHISANLTAVAVFSLIYNYTLPDTLHMSASMSNSVVASTTLNYTTTDTLHLSGSMGNSVVASTTLNYTTVDTMHTNAAVVSVKVTTVVVVYAFAETLHLGASISSANVT